MDASLETGGRSRSSAEAKEAKQKTSGKPPTAGRSSTVPCRWCCPPAAKPPLGGPPLVGERVVLHRLEW
eukprot:9972708-Lingulodinium_polyedra.AAC.1